MNIQDLKTYSTPEGFRGRSAFVVQLWWLIQSTLFGCSPQFMYGWRRFLLRIFGANIGRGVLIRPTVKVTYPWKLCIGDNTWVGDNVALYNLATITLGDNVVVSQRSYICTGSHDYKKPTFDIYADEVVINNQSWIATDVYIAPGVTIGQGTVIGARSSVFNDVGDNLVCIGSPAKPVKNRY
ncbi:MAG: colanic acid biosynthesis acetyltransferase WcaF [Alteromonadaceae bacterium TMED7]|nr:MAG: colanic acid biosynthesis acetyltransferase WcaF [Alteromonadaceae bacterium TMED7]|tara:strand:- start:17134 stop:17679 length:546 start_codon:yes stop_codon:yes gene_type:complete